MILSNSRFKRIWRQAFGSQHHRWHENYRRSGNDRTGGRKESIHRAINLRRKRLSTHYPDKDWGEIEDMTPFPGGLIDKGG